LTLRFSRATVDDVDIFVALEHKVANPRLYAPTLDANAARAEIAGNELYFIMRDGAAPC
jgi:hypothetical protein